MMPPRYFEDNIEIVSKLLTIFARQMVNKLLTIPCLRIELIKIPHIFQIGRRERTNIRKFVLQICTDRFIKSGAICCIFTHFRQVSAECPIETQHLFIDMNGCPDLAILKFPADTLNPLLVFFIIPYESTH